MVGSMPNMEQVDALKTLEDPAHRWTIGGFLHLTRDGLCRGRQLLTQTMFSQSVDQQAQHHHQTERHNALGFLYKDRRGQKEWIFEKTRIRAPRYADL
jgi:hypothetical protein